MRDIDKVITLAGEARKLHLADGARPITISQGDSEFVEWADASGAIDDLVAAGLTQEAGIRIDAGGREVTAVLAVLQRRRLVSLSLR